jgi:hypothetical protein
VTKTEALVTRKFNKVRLNGVAGCNSLAVDASGGFLYATVQADMPANSVFFGFSIDPADGSLTRLATSPYPAPAFPVDAVSLNIP